MLDYRPVVLIEGYFLTALGFLMLVPAVVDGLANNPDWQVFALGALFTIFAAGLMVTGFWRKQLHLNRRQGFLLTGSSWIIIAAFAALPFMFAGAKTSFTDAFFEAMSGLTTTGSTVFSGLDGFPPGLLLWRSLLQWVGGIGIIVMGVAMMPFLRVGGMQLFRMESSDTFDKAMPRAGQIAGSIAKVYVWLTLACATAYLLTGMTAFEAINHAMTTLSTGGFSTSDQSMAHFANPAVHWIATIFMALGGLPFLLYVRMLGGDRMAVLKNSQVQAFLYFLALTIIILTGYVRFWDGIALEEAFRLVSFNVLSVVTTTGYALGDYSTWGSFAAIAFFLLTFIGGCTGSTSGGIKIFRFEILFRALRNSLYQLKHPNRVLALRYDGKPLPPEVSRSVAMFWFQFFAITALIAVILAMTGLDFTTALTGAATAMANVGPGLGDVIGPAGNFASLSDMAKWVLAIAMLIGRLEIATLLVLFLPYFWEQ